MAWLRLTRPKMDRRFVGASALLVNVGCGRNGKPGWVNVDSIGAPGVTCVYDCRKHLPLATGSAKALFTEHLLEHLEYDDEVPAFLSECHRVLEPAGVIRIVVPDGRKYLTAYCTGDWHSLCRFSPLVTDRGPAEATMMEIVNEHFRQAGQHRFSYDYETLERLLRNIGFDAVVESRFGESRLPALAIDSPIRAMESLYVEARAAATRRP